MYVMHRDSYSKVSSNIACLYIFVHFKYVVCTKITNNSQ